MKYILFHQIITAYPELGLYVTQKIDQFYSPNSWTKLNEWDVTAKLTGAYNYDSQLINSEHVVAPNTGIYYATAITPITSVDTATELSLALVNGDDSNEDSFGLLSRSHQLVDGVSNDYCRCLIFSFLFSLSLSFYLKIFLPSSFLFLWNNFFFYYCFFLF